ncbi:uncharacterized protein LOC132737942 [Ruditapes philippinarum]|uniref:uncharacterized protein LOC132737942 n=1 Tax=Ruditapes philippinarum TaxID=129788 RepID=UPI00295AD634|nr:uncharacterized protein LOC132737942 [Ruditapes philippinarum]
MFWPNKCSSSLCQNNFSGSRTSEKIQYSSSKLSRRLVSSKQNKNVIVERSLSNTQSSLSFRVHHKQGKITTCSNANSQLSGQLLGFKKRASVSKHGKTGKIKNSGVKHSKGSMHCKTFFSPTRNDSLMSRAHSKCQAVHETYTTSFIKKLEPYQNESVYKNSFNTSTDPGSELVLIGSEHWLGQIITERQLSNNTDHRCQWLRLGRSHEQLDMSRTVDFVRKNASYKLSGNVSSYVQSQTFSIKAEGQKCSSPIRQYNCLPIHQSAGGHEISPIMQYDYEPLATGPGEQYFAESCSYFGKEECVGGYTEQGESMSDRVVLEQDSGSEIVRALGSSNDGPVCYFPEQKDSTVLLLDTPFSSICPRCSVNSMGKSLCLCVSTSTTCSQSTQSHAKISLYNNINSKSVAKTTSLSTVTENVNCKSNQSAMQPNALDSMQGSNITPLSRVSSFDCMAVVNRHWSSKGLSGNTRKLLSKSWRSGTRRDYQSKFKQFNSWCCERQIDPYIATLAECADFLTYLFDKGLKYRTINGYRSMLSSILGPVDNTPIGQHPFIIRLLRAVFNERPPLKKLVPEWDLLFILDSLKKAPFEPLKDASLRYLTWKVCFLLAITTFRRCSDLQSLRLGENYVNVQKKGLTFIRTGLSKQDRPNHSDRNIFIPALPKNRTLDPKRVLFHYLKRTEKFRNAGSDQEIVKLFIATKKPHKPVSAQTISRWLVSIIKFCYKSQSKDIGKIKGHSTRSIGPSFALFKGASLQQIMESADWSRETTFTRHYLRTINTDYMNV